jgi:cytochrome c oxidase assembly protein subunit 15
MGIHGAIEYGNRILAAIVVLIVGATLVATLLRRPRDRRLVLLAGLLAAGVLGQAVVGGITVLTGLNPYVVAAHFLVSMAALAAAYFLWARASGDRAEGVAAPVRWLAIAVVVTTIAVLTIGTVVTGSGPHAGDPKTPRTGFDPELVAQLHTDAVFLLLGLSVAAWLALRAIGAGRAPVSAAAILVGAELAQGVIGFVQYFTALPIALVAAHMAGACAVWLAALHLYATTRAKPAT